MHLPRIGISSGTLVAFAIAQAYLGTTVESKEPKDLVRACMGNVSGIDNIEFRWTAENKSSKFILVGSKYRLENENGDVVAFDGATPQRFTSNVSILLLNKPQTVNVYGNIVPIMLPFQWVIPRGSAMSWENVKRLEYWENAMSTAKHERVEEFESFGPCDVISIDRPTEKNSRIEIWLSQSLNAFPVKWHRVDRGSSKESIRIEVHSVKESTYEGGKALMPVKLILNQSGIDHSLAMNREFAVDVKSIHVNHKADDNTFQIPRNIAKTILDTKDR